jgi:hypothetical protein
MGFAWSKLVSISRHFVTLLVPSRGAGAGICPTLNSEDVVGCSWVVVGWQHAARPKLDHRHCQLVANDGLNGKSATIEEIARCREAKKANLLAKKQYWH